MGLNEVRCKIRAEWRALWDQRVQDKVAAEDVARRHYPFLFVDRGTVIRATRGYAPPNLEEIWRQHEDLLGAPLSAPDPAEGGWGRFARTHLTTQPRWRRPHPEPPQRRRSGPPKQGGRGWLHRD